MIRRHRRVTTLIIVSILTFSFGHFLCYTKYLNFYSTRADTSSSISTQSRDSKESTPVPEEAAVAAGITTPISTAIAVAPRTPIVEDAQPTAASAAAAAGVEVERRSVSGTAGFSSTPWEQGIHIFNITRRPSKRDPPRCHHPSQRRPSLSKRQSRPVSQPLQQQHQQRLQTLLLPHRSLPFCRKSHPSQRILHPLHQAPRLLNCLGQRRRKRQPLPSPKRRTISKQHITSPYPRSFPPNSIVAPSTSTARRRSHRTVASIPPPRTSSISCPYPRQPHRYRAATAWTSIRSDPFTTPRNRQPSLRPPPSPSIPARRRPQCSACPRSR